MQFVLYLNNLAELNKYELAPKHLQVYNKLNNPKQLIVRNVACSLVDSMFCFCIQNKCIVSKKLFMYNNVLTSENYSIILITKIILQIQILT